MTTEEEYSMRVKRRPKAKFIKERREGVPVTIFNPHCDFSSGMFTRILSIKLTPECTRIEIKGSCTDTFVAAKCLKIDKNTFMTGRDSGRNYKLLKTIGIPFKPNVKRFKKGQKIFYFTLIFEPLPFYENQIDIKETANSIWVGPDFCFTEVGLWKNNLQYVLKDYSKS